MTEFLLKAQRPALLEGFDNEIHILAKLTAPSAPKKLKKRKSLNLSIVIDESLEHVLARQDLNLQDIPMLGDKVFVRRTANLATGGETIDITNKINPKIKNMAIRAAKELQMSVAGFDFMCRDYTKDKGFFIEVNPIPGFMMHHYPHHGRKRNPAKKLIQMLIKNKLI